MICNAVLMRVDPPGDVPSETSIVVRLALTPLTTEQARTSRAMEWDAALVAYIPRARLPQPAPQVGGEVLIRADGEDSAVAYRVVHLIERIGHTLSHMQLFLRFPLPSGEG